MGRIAAQAVDTATTANDRQAANAVVELEALNARPQFRHSTSELMTEHGRLRGIRLNHMQVTATNASAFNLEQYLSQPGSWNVDLFDGHVMAPMQHRSMHMTHRDAS
ncbi:hypothetical protein D9M71_548670 [compost metagenome]